MLRNEAVSRDGGPRTRTLEPEPTTGIEAGAQETRDASAGGAAPEPRISVESSRPDTLMESLDE